jgi:hypothetical protein
MIAGITVPVPINKMRGHERKLRRGVRSDNGRPNR